MREHADLVRAWRALAPGTEAVLATVIATRGSVYRRPGARMLLTREGWMAGSISGGCLESDLVQTAFDRTVEGSVVVTYDASAPDDVLLGFGLGCSGAVDVLMHRLPEDGGPLAIFERVLAERKEATMATFPSGGVREVGADFGGEALLVERIAPPPALVIFGAGHDAVPLVRLAKGVGWHVTVVDGRAAYARADRFPEADAVILAAPAVAQERVTIEPGSAVALMTHSFAHDAALLPWLCGTEAAYLGVLGPMHRTQRLLDEMAVPGERLNAPIGLDLGAEGPDEIALAIVAEIQAVLKGRSAQSLKGRTRPLHAREDAHVGRLG